MKTFDPTPSRKKSQKPPPNYRSRRVQVRLLLLVSMLMLVLVLMQKAANPKMWYWVWGGGQPIFSDGIFSDQPPLDTRLPDDALQNPGHRPNSRSAAAPKKKPNANQDSPPGAIPENAVQDDDATRIELDAWQTVLDSLDADETRLLWAVLKSTRDDQTPNLGQEPVWTSLVGKLSSGWREYLDDAAAALEKMGEGIEPEEKAGWLALLETTRHRWQSQDLPAFETLQSDVKPTASQLAVFVRVQNRLDRIALAQVEDDTVLWRKEFPAMFRMWEQLQAASLDELEARRSDSPSFLSLFRQPEDYRGKLVTVRGFAHQGYRLDAPANYVGIKEYTVLWVRPVGGINAPMVVYCLELPPGFPPVKHKVRDGGVSELNETVSFTGYFLKRWAYLAQDGSRTAPLLLAKEPRWTPNVSPLDARQPPSAFSGVLIVLGTAAGSILIALGVYLQSRWRSAQQREYEASGERIASGLSLLEQADPPPTIEESLRRLSRGSDE